MFNLRALTLLVAVIGASAVPRPQDRTSEQGEAQILDPNQECKPYSYPPTAQYISQFPPIWQPAKLLSSDSAGQAFWANISSSIPNIAPKGQLNGSTINETYNGAQDPDCWWTATQCITPKIPGLSQDVANVPEPKTMGYGFDDGPNCSHNAFYDFLESQNQKASLFYIGSNVMDWPLEAQRGVADGHEICAHTWSHRYMTAFASQDAFAELWYSMKAIKVVTGVTPTCWRPPYGDVDDRIRAIAHALGLQTIIWRFDSSDWRVGTANVTTATVDGNYQGFINNVTSGVFNTAGGIMLTHELNNYTMQEAINWYPQLKAAFSYMVPIGVALNKTYPYQEKNYTIPTFQQYISGQVAVTGTNGTGSSSAATSGSSSSPSASASTESGSKKSSAQSLSVQGGALPWTVLSATALLAGLML